MKYSDKPLSKFETAFVIVCLTVSVVLLCLLASQIVDMINRYI